MQETQTLAKPTQDQESKNRVLPKGAKVSANFYHSDLVLKDFLGTYLSSEAKQYATPLFENLGNQAATVMDSLSLDADKNGPQLIKRNFYGEDINEIKFHPSYWELTYIAVQSQMFRMKWEPELRSRFSGELHQLGFAQGLLFSMAEGGLYCPLCMTDGVARLIDRFASIDDKEKLLPRIYTEKAQDFFTGAMFLTEKAGGSDVGANLVSATHWKGDYYLLNGEKWFCSNANAEIIFALARTNPEIKGTKGLSIFLIEKQKPDGSKNEMDIVRLKDKLGVRSMASAEIRLTNTVGKLIGEEFQGFKIMTEMINLSRLYNSVSAISLTRRAQIEAFQFLSYRKTFGKTALQHALIREKLTEVNALYLANFYLTFRAIQALDKADNGDEKEKALLRMLTPMVKKSTAENGVYSIRECMELMGGIGYIEDGVIPKLMRDCMVLPIWEGAGNIMILDMLRASIKSGGLPLMLKEIGQVISGIEETEKGTLQRAIEELVQQLEALKSVSEQDTVELGAKKNFEELTRLYQICVLYSYETQKNKHWIKPARKYLIAKWFSGENSQLLTSEEVAEMTGWKI